MLKIENLEVTTDNKKILKNFNMVINDGEIHVIMGPNGTGKSTLSRVIMGDPNYKIINGSIEFNGDNLNSFSTDERAKKGIFLAMQYPMEIEGVSNQDFLRTAISSINNKRIGLYDFILKCEKGAEELSMNKDLIHRSLNVGFSGGEKKKNEVLQIKLLMPKFIILDELDSGLDVDSLRITSENIKKYVSVVVGLIMIFTIVGKFKMFSADMLSEEAVSASSVITEKNIEYSNEKIYY